MTLNKTAKAVAISLGALSFVVTAEASDNLTFYKKSQRSNVEFSNTLLPQTTVPLLDPYEKDETIIDKGNENFSVVNDKEGLKYSHGSSLVIKAQNIGILGDHKTNSEYQNGLTNVSDTETSNAYLVAQKDINIEGFSNGVVNKGKDSGVFLVAENDINLKGNGFSSDLKSPHIFNAGVTSFDNSNVGNFHYTNIYSKNDINISSFDAGLLVDYSKAYSAKSEMLLHGHKHININDVNYGIVTLGNGSSNITSTVNLASEANNIVANKMAISANKGEVKLFAKDNYLQADDCVVFSSTLGKINIWGNTTIKLNNSQKDDAYAIYSQDLVDINTIIPPELENIADCYTVIYGDIYAGRNGKIMIGNGKYIEGDLITDHKGSILLEVNGKLVGKTRLYSDKPEQSNLRDYSDLKPGFIKIMMNELYSSWDVTGQSFVSELEMFGSNVNLREAKALTVQKIGSEGDGAGIGSFSLDLDATNHKNSDMLYIYGGQGIFGLDVKDFVGMSDFKEGDKIRFATVYGDEILFVSASMKGEGLYDLYFSVNKEQYDKNDKENADYNNKVADGEKPGNSYVSQSVGDKGYNYYIDGIKKRVASSVVSAIENSSQANYANAVYMDNLNKRLGEARYANGIDGLWARARHDNIDKDNGFESKNTMYEIGLDRVFNLASGTNRVGIAIDYMEGDIDFANGQGDVERKGFWLYDNWFSDKGHYMDYVLKYGHLNNTFDTDPSRDRGVVSGDYSNNVISLSAEYGFKKAFLENYFFEPQIQMQYSKVSKADYTTSQGTNVTLDAIDSLIARAGMRLGFNIGKTFEAYVKSDIYREFLGDQDVYA